MKSLKQIIKVIENYKCSEGSETDRELRNLIIRVDLLFDVFMHLDSHVKRFENVYDSFGLFNDLFEIFKALDPSIKAVEEKGKTGLGDISNYQCLQIANMVFERKELMAKYEGKDKMFVENITKDIDDYVNTTYGNKN